MTDICAECQALRQQLNKHEADLKAAAGEHLVPIPEPGTDMAKMMMANRLLRTRVSKLETDLHNERLFHKDALAGWVERSQEVERMRRWATTGKF